MNKQELRKRQSEGGKKSALGRWGIRFAMSVFPQKGGMHRVTIRIKDKEVSFAGKDRLLTMDKAFDFIREN